MALTLEAEQRLNDTGIVEYYTDNAEAWLETVRDAKEFVARRFPADATIRRDDVAKALVPIVEVHEGYKDYRKREKLRGKYWIKDFADLLIDRTWDQLQEEERQNENPQE